MKRSSYVLAGDDHKEHLFVTFWNKNEMVSSEAEMAESGDDQEPSFLPQLLNIFTNKYDSAEASLSL